MMTSSTVASYCPKCATSVLARHGRCGWCDALVQPHKHTACVHHAEPVAWCPGCVARRYRSQVSA